MGLCGYFGTRYKTISYPLPLIPPTIGRLAIFLDICVPHRENYRKYTHIPDASDSDTQLEKPPSLQGVSRHGQMVAFVDAAVDVKPTCKG